MISLGRISWWLSIKEFTCNAVLPNVILILKLGSKDVF